jgi:hypothetical protein
MVLRSRHGAGLDSRAGTSVRSAGDGAGADAIRAARPIADHPTRRDDGRTPNPREADTALAASMNAPVEALELLVQPETLDLEESSTPL